MSEKGAPAKHAAAVEPESVHASAVAVDGKGLLILGAPGAGKSALALRLLALGARLVADDRTLLWREGEATMMQAPAPIRGLIEARGVGLLRAEAQGPVPLTLVTDLDTPETHRLPPPRERRVLGRIFPLLHGVESAHFPAALIQYIRHGRVEEP